MRTTSTPHIAAQAALAVTTALALGACGFDVSAQGEPQETETPTVAEEAADATTAAKASEPSAPPATVVDSETDAAPEDTDGGEVIALDLEQRHPNGALLRLHQLTVGPTSIAVQLSAVNGYRDEVTLASSSIAGMVVTDDLGTSYNWSEPDENGSLEVAPGGTLDAEVVFLGELDEGATVLTLTSNPDQENFDDANSSLPSFRFEIPLSGEAAASGDRATAPAEEGPTEDEGIAGGDEPAGDEDPAGEDPAGEDPAGEDPADEGPAEEDPAEEEPADEPAPASRVVEVGQEQRHPNGALLRIERLTVEPTFLSVELSAVNGYRDEVSLARSSIDGMVVTDDLGNTYNWSEPEENGSLEVAPGGTLQGTVIFLGELDQGATALTLTSNPDLESFDDANSSLPSFRFEIPLS